MKADARKEEKIFGPSQATFSSNFLLFARPSFLEDVKSFLHLTALLQFRAYESPSRVTPQPELQASRFLSTAEIKIKPKLNLLCRIKTKGRENAMKLEG